MDVIIYVATVTADDFQGVLLLFGFARLRARWGPNAPLVSLCYVCFLLVS